MRPLTSVERLFKEICPGHYKTPEEINMEYIRPKSEYLTKTFPHISALDNGNGGNVFAVERGKGAYELMDTLPPIKRPSANKAKRKAQKQARKQNRK